MNRLTLGISELYFDPSNVRKHDAKNLEAITASLKRFGQQKPIVIDSNNIVRAGNGTLSAAKALGWDTIECIVSDLSTEELTAYAIADNRTGELAEWDDDALAAQLSAMDEDLRKIAYDDYELPEDEALPSEDDDVVPETSDNERGVKLGDLWILGEHRLLCGDSTDEATVGKLMGGEKADMVFTDPPYGISIVNNNSVGASAKPGFGSVGAKGIVKEKKYKKIIGDDEFFDPTFILDLSDNIILWGANNYSSHLPDNAQWLVWDKKCEKGADHNNFSDCELAWTNFKKKSVRIYRYLWSGLLREGDRKTELKDRVHPTQKPVGLCVHILNDFPHNLILDLFLGSGSTLIACEKTNRRCYGMELDPHYCSVIIKRWEEFSGKAAHKADN